MGGKSEGGNAPAAELARSGLAVRHRSQRRRDIRVAEVDIWAPGEAAFAPEEVDDEGQHDSFPCVELCTAQVGMWARVDNRDRMGSAMRLLQAASHADRTPPK